MSTGGLDRPHEQVSRQAQLPGIDGEAGALAMRAVRERLGYPAWRSTTQADIVRLALTKEAGIGVMGTAGGKTAAMMAPMAMPGCGTVLVVVPYRSLQLDVVRRCQAFGFQVVATSGMAGGDSVDLRAMIAGLMVR
jgi:superfamily II DNA helicase RecQ